MMKRWNLLALGFAAVAVSIMSCEDKKDETPTPATNVLSAETIKGTWKITKAASAEWEKGKGKVFETNNDTKSIGSTLLLDGSKLLFSDTQGKSDTLTYALNGTMLTGTKGTSSKIFDITNFTGTSMVMTNPDPTDAMYEAKDDGSGGTVYKYNQNMWTVEKQ